MGETVEIQQVLRVKLSKSAFLMVSRALTALNVYPEIVADLEVGRSSVKVYTHVLIEFHPEAEIPLLVDEGVDALVVAVV